MSFKFPRLMRQPRVSEADSVAELMGGNKPVQLDRLLLRDLGYSDAALDTLEAEIVITYSDDDTPDGHSIWEYPNGYRKLQKVELFGEDHRVRVTTVKTLGKARR